MSTVHHLLSKAEELLQSTETARLDAEILLASLLNTERSSLYARPEEEVSQTINADYHSLLLKRQQGFPVAYLIGKKEFWSLGLSVTQDTLIPRPETECLVELALKLIPQDTEMHILDMGTGSGAIAIAIAKERPKCQIVAIDVSVAALAIAQSNVENLKLNNIELRKSDWFSDIGTESFDLILSNPPYVETSDNGFEKGDIRFEPRLALDAGPKGLDTINSLIPSARKHLKKGAYLLLEHGYTHGDNVRRLFDLHHYTDINTHQDYTGLERISLGKFA